MADSPIGVPLDSIAHVIQVASIPVFPLSGAGMLPNVFTSRLARVTDHKEHLADLLRAAPIGNHADKRSQHLHRLRRRTTALDSAVGLGATAGAATALATLPLFVGTLRESAAASALFLLFGVAVLCTVLALAVFLAETVLSWIGIRDEGALPSPATRRP